jgi:hypothetical protein
MRTAFLLACVAAAGLASSLRFAHLAAADPSARPAAVAAPAAARPTTTTAAPAADPARMVNDDCARARLAGKPCVLEVAAEDVPAEAATAGQLTLHAATFHPPPSLIRVRRDFVVAIVKTAEDL